MSLSKFWEMMKDRVVLQSWGRKESEMTERKKKHRDNDILQTLT